jgi:FSR family fosmidomycin resistance protein-like MFS transporter
MSPFRNRNLVSLSMVHFTVDFFSGALPIVLATLTTPLHLTQSQVGIIAFTYSMSISLARPLFGLVADSIYAPRLALAGVVWQVLLMGLTGLAGRFELLLGLVAVGGLGSAAFHPPGAGSVPRLSTPEQRGSAMSVFLLGGNTGYAVGPLLAGFVLNRFGQQGMWFLLAGGLSVLPFLAWRLIRLRYEPIAHTHPHEAGSFAPTQAENGRFPTALVALLSLLIIFRSWGTMSLTTFLPQLLQAQGDTVEFGGQALFLISIAGAMGGFAAGFLADRIGPHKIIIATLLAAGPLLVALPHSTGLSFLILSAAVGLCLMASLPLTLLLGQSLFPGRPGVMSGMTLGFTFIAGGIGAGATGAIAEIRGLDFVFQWLPALPLLSVIAAMAFALWQQREIRKGLLARA